MLTPGDDQATDAESVSHPAKQPEGRWKDRPEGWRAYVETKTPPTPREGRDMGLVDALKVQALIHFQACEARLTARQYRVLMAVLAHLLRWQRLEDRAPAAVLARFSGIPQSGVGTVLKELDALGFISYARGTGKTLSRVRIIVPEDWAAKCGPWVSPDSDDPASSDSGDPGSTDSGDPASPESVDRPGGLSRETLTGGKDGGGETVASLSLVKASPIPLPVETNLDPQAVAAEFFDAMRQTGAPMPSSKQRTMTNGITQAMTDGYSREAVLVGLGYWVADGHLFAKQITEFVQKARLHGGPVPEHGEADELLTEGRDRFTLRRALRANGGPSRAEARRAASAAAIREFTRGTQ